MKRERLLEIVGHEPLFTTGMLLGPGVDPKRVRVQLSRWTRDGTVVQLRRGLYALGEPYRAREPHPYEVSNALVPGSYVSLETVLSERGVIPEAVFVTSAVTTGRQGARKTPLGVFVYRHVKRELFWGYGTTELERGREVFVADTEKALLDLAYLVPGSDEPPYARELRLQHLDEMDLERLVDYAGRFESPKMRRFAENVVHLAAEEREAYGSS
jgi:predicted transcriptional regulator of viral defense system